MSLCGIAATRITMKGAGMFVAMNRFKIAPGREQQIIEVWKHSEPSLETVPGFTVFHLLRGPSNEECTLVASHSFWESRAAFDDWTKSEGFRRAHAQAGGAKGIYLGPPQFEGFELVLCSHAAGRVLQCRVRF